MLRIRPIEDRDIAACLAIYNYYIEHTTITFEEEPLSLAAFSERVRRICADYPYLIAEESGEVVGYAYLDAYNERSAYRYTADLSIYLARDSLGRGAGASLLAAMVVLAIMILPSIIKVSVNALDAVPKEYEDASLALGATPVETWFRVSAPAARSGIAAAVVLGVGRAIGEAMAVMMVSGNAPNMPSLFESVRFLTTAVASEMSYASGLQRQALFSIALVLYLFIMLINAALNFFLKRKKE